MNKYRLPLAPSTKGLLALLPDCWIAPTHFDGVGRRGKRELIIKAGSFNGRTGEFGSPYRGSTPLPAEKVQGGQIIVPPMCECKPTSNGLLHLYKNIRCPVEGQ